MHDSHNLLEIGNFLNERGTGGRGRERRFLYLWKL